MTSQKGGEGEYCSLRETKKSRMCLFYIPIRLPVWHMQDKIPGLNPGRVIFHKKVRSMSKQVCVEKTPLPRVIILSLQTSHSFLNASIDIIHEHGLMRVFTSLWYQKITNILRKCTVKGLRQSGESRWCYRMSSWKAIPNSPITCHGRIPYQVMTWKGVISPYRITSCKVQ